MARRIDTQAVINAVRLLIGAKPSAPAAGYDLLYAKTGGLYVETESGTETGPLMGNPMTAAGDVIVGGTSGAPARLAKGSDGQYLTLSSGTPAWGTLTIPASDGWIAADALTYAGADGVTFTATCAGDKTGTYSPGMRVKLTQTAVKYFIITAVAYTSPTTLTLYGGTDYTLADAAITAPYYSTQKAPHGFPLAPDKWTVTVTDGASREQASPTQNAWYNLNSNAITVPIGVWNLGFTGYITCYKSTASYVWAFVTLSTAADAESDKALSGGVGSFATYISGTVTVSKVVTLAAKTVYYYNIRTDQTSISSIYEDNDKVTLVIRAVCAYL